MSQNMENLTDATFEGAIGSGQPVLVDFWAEWCGPCKAVAPVLADIATEFAGKITIAKLNIDDNPQSTAKSDVMSIPTMIVFKDGIERKRIVGARRKDDMIRELADFIG
jgi:thioredoxin 1